MLGLIQATTEFLARRGIASARLDAEVLLAHVLGRTRLQLYVLHDMPVDDLMRDRYRALVKSRGTFEPVAYLVGAREFYGLSMTVDRRVLVPRPETEHLVDAALEWLRRRDASAPRPRVVDVCTGSGCIVAALAHEFPAADYLAVDVSADALAVARINVERHAPGAVTLLQGDLLGAIDPALPIDLLVSNPPYVTRAEFAELPDDVRRHEPEIALLAGDDPVAFHRRIVTAAWPRIREGGRLALELGGGGAELVEWARSALPGGAVALRPDYAGLPRVIVIDRPVVRDG